MNIYVYTQRDKYICLSCIVTLSYEIEMVLSLMQL